MPSTGRGARSSRWPDHLGAVYYVPKCIEAYQGLGESHPDRTDHEHASMRLIQRSQFFTSPLVYRRLRLIVALHKTDYERSPPAATEAIGGPFSHLTQ
jgi:hypothetical protein